MDQNRRPDSEVKPNSHPRAPYRPPVVREEGRVLARTLNTTEGAEPEGWNDNIVWGN